MPLTCVCPQCQKTLAVSDEFAGQMMRCPLCGATFQSPPARGDAAAAPTVVFDVPAWMNSDSPATAPEPRRPRVGYDWSSVRNGVASRLGSGWHQVRRGLSIMPGSLTTAFFLLIASRSFLVMADPGPRVEELVLLLAVPLCVLGTIVALVGSGLCILVPKESGLRPLAIAATACLFGCLVVSLVTFAVRVLFLKMAGRVELMSLAYLPAVILLLAGAVLFLLFLRGVARCFENRRLEQGVFYCAIGLGASPLAYLFVWVLMYLTSASVGGDGTGLAILSAVVFYLIAAADLFWFLQVLTDVRRTVQRAYLHAMA